MTDGSPETGQAVADRLASSAWARRVSYIVKKVPVEDAIDQALWGEGVFALSDGADSPTAGGCGDGNLLLASLMARSIDVPCLLSVVDPVAADVCHSAGIGAFISTRVGGRLNPNFYRPIEVTGTVAGLFDGHFVSEYGGNKQVNMGRTAVLLIGSTTLMISEFPAPMVDYQAYLSVGLDPREMKIVQPKSAGAYRHYYEPIGTCLDLDLPGPSASDLTKLPFKHIPRPLWPWDFDLDEPW